MDALKSRGGMPRFQPHSIFRKAPGGPTRALSYLSLNSRRNSGNTSSSILPRRAREDCILSGCQSHAPGRPVRGSLESSKSCQEQPTSEPTTRRHLACSARDENEGALQRDEIRSASEPALSTSAMEQAGAGGSRRSRRDFVLLGFGALAIPALAPTPMMTSASAAVSVQPATIDLTTMPMDPFDPSDETLLRAAEIFETALDAASVEEEEERWTQVIKIAEGASPDAPWVGDILSRAYGNRGNARSRQGKLDDAIRDYNKAIALAPYAADPVLNRGVALESLKRFDEAASDYKAVLAVNPTDPGAWNNLGNVMAAIGNWEHAAANYKIASDLAPEFSFAAGNFALALYQLGDDNAALKQMRSLLRRYPEFPDIRAALAVSLYSAGIIADAESNWTRLEDLRYKNVNWVRDVRRWPPRLVSDLEKFLKVAPA